MSNRDLLGRILSGDRGALRNAKRDKEKDIASIIAEGTKEQEQEGKMALCIYYKGNKFENEKRRTSSREELESYFKRSESVLIIGKHYENKE